MRVPSPFPLVTNPCMINQFIFGQWVVIYIINATSVEENHQKTNLIYSQMRSSAVHHLVYFHNRYGNPSTDGIFDIAALTVHFVVKSSFSCLSVR